MKELPVSRAEDFSLVAGGPAYRVMLRLRLARPDSPRIGRRATVLAAITWVPLLALSWWQGVAVGTAVTLPFLEDWAAHVRFLVALPVLVAAEPTIADWVAAAVRQFVGADLVREGELSEYEAALQRSVAWRDSVGVEAALFVLAYARTLFAVTDWGLGQITTWRVAPTVFDSALSAAGWWHTLVSLPILRFIIYRWGWRFAIWCAFLWRVSRLDLRLTPIHPDGAGGLGFLRVVQARFGVVVFALSAVLSAAVGARAHYANVTVADSRFLLIGFVVMAVVVVLAPLFVFSGKLLGCRARGWLEYGQLGSRYAAAFDSKWVKGDVADEEELLGTGDIQSLADLSNSFGVVRNMRVYPFDLMSVIAVASAAAAPTVPLLLSVVPLSEILKALADVLL